MKVRKGFIAALFMAMWAVVIIPQVSLSQQTYYFPTTFLLSPLGVAWTAGTVNNGGHAVAISSGSAAVTANKTDCSSPGFASCNFVISNSGGTVSVTATSGTANASGTTLLAIVETNGTTITNIVYPSQVNTGSVFIK